MRAWCVLRLRFPPTARRPARAPRYCGRTRSALQDRTLEPAIAIPPECWFPACCRSKTVQCRVSWPRACANENYNCVVRISASAPTRIDLAGGTIDIWPLYLFHAGAQTLNAAISLRARAWIEERPDERIEHLARR